MLDVIFREAPQDRFGVRCAESQRGGELDEFVVLPFNDLPIDRPSQDWLKVHGSAKDQKPAKRLRKPRE